MSSDANFDRIVQDYGEGFIAYALSEADLVATLEGRRDR